MKSSTFSLGPKKTPKNNVGLVVVVGGGWGEGVGRDKIYGAKCNLNEKCNNMCGKMKH